MAEAYIVSAVRTAGGRRNGRLAGWHPVDLAAKVLDALLDRSGAPPDLIDDVIMGCVSQIGEQSTNVARSAVLASRLSESVSRHDGGSPVRIFSASDPLCGAGRDVRRDGDRHRFGCGEHVASSDGTACHAAGKKTASALT